MKIDRSVEKAVTLHRTDYRLIKAKRKSKYKLTNQNVQMLTKRLLQQPNGKEQKGKGKKTVEYFDVIKRSEGNFKYNI